MTKPTEVILQQYLISFLHQTQGCLFEFNKENGNGK